MPTTEQIKTIFHPLSIQNQQSEFFNHVSDTVHWTILGHSPMSKTYHSKTDFARDTLQYLRERVLTEPLRLEVLHVVAGEDGWATVEMRAIDARCKNGLEYDMRYCWVVKFDEKNIITEVRAYLDTKLLSDAMEQNQ